MGFCKRAVKLLVSLFVLGCGWKWWIFKILLVQIKLDEPVKTVWGHKFQLFEVNSGIYIIIRAPLCVAKDK